MQARRLNGVFHFPPTAYRLPPLFDPRPFPRPRDAPPPGCFARDWRFVSTIIPTASSQVGIERCPALAAFWSGVGSSEESFDSGFSILATPSTFFAGHFFFFDLRRRRDGSVLSVAGSSAVLVFSSVGSDVLVSFTTGSGCSTVGFGSFADSSLWSSAFSEEASRSQWSDGF